MTSRACILVAASLTAAFLLAGCGDDRPVSGPPPGSDAPAAQAPTSAPLASTPVSSAPDPLLSRGEGIPTNDPLTAHQAPFAKETPQIDPIVSADPLTPHDPLQGRAMPTDHSHWLRGRVQGARLTVLLNGVREGVYTGVVDRDITMTLRRGINSVSFVYAPSRADASAQMNLLESEHDPPIPPLAAFQSLPISRDPAVSEQATALRTTTQSFTFYAK